MADTTDGDAPPHSLLAGAALFLDFDGTLVELAETPDAIRVPEGLAGLLARLSNRLNGRLAIVTGRGLGDLELYLDCSAIAVAGSHGLEIRTAETRQVRGDAPTLPTRVRAEIDAFAAAAKGVLVEEKPFGLAVHYRQAPSQEAAVIALLDRIARESGLDIQHGKMVAELRPFGADKGDAVRALIAEPNFTGARPIFMGDDLTDESAFAAAAAMGGAGILIGPARPSAARWRLPDVAAAAHWLDEGARQ